MKCDASLVYEIKESALRSVLIEFDLTQDQIDLIIDLVNELEKTD